MKNFSSSEKKMKYLKSKEHTTLFAKGSAGVKSCSISEPSVLRPPLPVTAMITCWMRGGKRKNK